MTLIRVNPQSVQTYGAEAQGLFEGMQQSLVRMVDDVVGVRYYGPNAVAFKTEAGQMASDFANRLHQDLAAMADAVSRTTSNIAGSLGGAPITITVDPRPIVAPAPEVVDYVDIDTSALEGQIPAVSARFEELRQNLATNLRRLESTDWEGNAKQAAVTAVGGFTSAAQAKCSEGQQALVDFMRRQVDSVMAVDR